MKINVIVFTITLLGAVSAELKLATAQPPGVPNYQVIDLGTLGGNYISAHGINHNGQVVGSSFVTANGPMHAFLYSDGLMRDLGTLGGYNNGAYGINDSGQVVGYAFTQQHAFLYYDGLMRDLGTLGGPYSVAYGINRNGQVVGSASIGNGNQHAFLYSNGSMQDLDTFGSGFSRACGINENGQVAGFVSLPGGYLPDSYSPHAFLYSNGSMKDLGTLMGIFGASEAYGINDSGQIVGSSTKGRSYRHAFLYSDGSMQDLGTLDGNGSDSYSLAYGINANGQIVGEASFIPHSNYSHAFLYSNGTMYDLNDLIASRVSGWRLDSATAINDVWQIVGSGINPQGHPRAFLLNPLPLGWRQAIETQPAQPTYGTPPVKENAKDSLVVVTHGWVPKESGQTAPPNPNWVDTMTNAISTYLVNQGLNNWQVEAYRWTEKAWMGKLKMITGTLLDNADTEGINLGNRLKSQGWKHIHFIAHSAGAALIQAASLLVKEHDVTTTIHNTFLDAYVGFTYGGRSKYGLASDWSDSYFARDPDTVDILTWLTSGHLDYAYNVDVTWLDTNKVSRGTYRSSWNGDIEQCYQTVTSHGWSYKFYLETITGSLPETETKGFGFPLSQEGGNWDFAVSQYKAGNNPPLPLGTPDPSCIPDITPPSPDWKLFLDFTKLLFTKSSTGTSEVKGNGFKLITGSPVWVAMDVETTNAINLLSLEAGFMSSAGSEGLLSVYWDTNVLGSIDERISSGLRQYTFVLPKQTTGGTHLLGFRLDPFSATTSSAVITNVALGFVGIRDPFSLYATGKQTNGLPVLQLNGPAGYNYVVEVSTNLIDWKAVAVLVNTNGTVRFTDSTSTSAPSRFYRAVAP